MKNGNHTIEWKETMKKKINQTNKCDLKGIKKVRNTPKLQNSIADFE